MKAVILAAGKGTRLQPLTLTRPKHLVPVAGKPIIGHVLTTLKQAGINEALLIVNYMAESLRQHLGNGAKYEMKLEYAVQEQLNGTAGAAKLAQPYAEDDFLLTYGDWLTTPQAIDAVLQTHEREKPVVTMGVVPVENPEYYGIVELDDSYIKRIIEKPSRSEAPTKLANAGVYVLSRRIFEAIEQTKPSARGELEITDSFSLLLEEGCRIAGAQIPRSEMFDVGLLWDLLEANRWALGRERSRIEGNIEDAAHIVGSVTVEEGARIRSGAYILGPAFIGRNSDIGPNCFIRPHTSIGESVRIGNACEVKNSIVMDNTHIGHLSYVGDSIIGQSCNLGAGTTVANYRFDGGTIKMSIKDSAMDTGRRKLGVVLGDEVKTGINTSLMPGVKVGNNSWIGPGVVVYRDVLPNSVLLLKQEHEQRESTATSSVASKS